jgi:hypothetical protein
LNRPASRGRPLDPGLDRKIFDVAIALFGEEGCGGKLAFPLFDSRIAMFPDLPARIVSQIARFAQRDLGILPENQSFLLARKAIFKAPGLRPSRRDEQIEPPASASL